MYNFATQIDPFFNLLCSRERLMYPKYVEDRFVQFFFNSLLQNLPNVSQKTPAMICIISDMIVVGWLINARDGAVNSIKISLYNGYNSPTATQQPWVMPWHDQLAPKADSIEKLGELVRLYKCNYSLYEDCTSTPGIEQKTLVIRKFAYNASAHGFDL